MGCTLFSSMRSQALSLLCRGPRLSTTQDKGAASTAKYGGQANLPRVTHYAPHLFFHAAKAYAQQSRRAQGMTHLGHAGRLSNCKRGGVPRSARQAGYQVQHRSGDGDRRLAVPGLQLAAHGPVVHHALSPAPAYAVQYRGDTRVHTGEGKEVDAFIAP